MDDSAIYSQLSISISAFERTKCPSVARCLASNFSRKSFPLGLLSCVSSGFVFPVPLISATVSVNAFDWTIVGGQTMYDAPDCRAFSCWPPCFSPCSVRDHPLPSFLSYPSSESIRVDFVRRQIELLANVGGGNLFGLSLVRGGFGFGEADIFGQAM